MSGMDSHRRFTALKMKFEVFYLLNFQDEDILLSYVKLNYQ